MLWRGTRAHGRRFGAVVAHVVVVAVAGGSHATETKRTDPQAVSDSAPVPVAPSDDKQSSPVWTIGKWTGLVGGGLGLAAGTALYLMGSSDESTITDARRDGEGRVRGVTQSQAATLQDSASTKMTAGAVTLGIGAALLAGGVVLWAFEPNPVTNTPQPESSPRERPYSAVPTTPPFVVEFGSGVQVRGVF